MTQQPTIGSEQSWGKLSYDLFIGGKWRKPSAGGRIEVIDPSTERVVGSVADATISDAIAAVDAAEAAAADWAATAPRRRADILMRAFAIMTERVEYLAELISRENGKALPDARGEVAYAAEFLRWYAEEAVRIRGELYVSPSVNSRIVVQQQPVGISVLVTPWNFPAAMATRKIGPALAAGCTCILKPATETPLTAYAVAVILAEAGVPDGVINVVTTMRSGEVVRAMLRDRRVRKLSFTGSTDVGRVLLREAAENIISCSMELGGNAPFIVFDDADVDAAIDGAMVAKMRNGGEACTAANRFYVQRSLVETFCEKFAARMKVVRLGVGYEPKTELGPLVNADSRKKVISLVEDAVAHGARIIVGGRTPDREGYFYEPTVLTDVPDDAAMLSEEIFGPVAPVVAFDTEAEAIELANRTEYGLVAYIYTRDLARGLRVSERIESGMIALNRGLVSDAAAPFGGMKFSGLGREGSHHGLQEFIELKYIATNW
jgi:succinate-semialdehyde dehydrogenase/glutarate-semialdehyde dehydrogenase